MNVFRKIVFKDESTDFLAVVSLALMLGWFCDGMLFADQIPMFRDLGPYFYPIKFSVAQAFSNGELPLWDRHMAGGFPVMAGIQSAVFYPPSLIFALLPFFTAIQVTFLFHYAVAASGAYVLFRWWKLPPYVSVIGAVLFTFGGTTVALSNLLNHFQSAVWLPWAILLWERTLKRERWEDFVCCSVVLLCQLLAGSPELFAISLAILLVDAIRLHREQEIANLYKPLAIFIVANIVVVGLGMVQLLPTGELILQSRRDQAIPASEAFSWSLLPASLIGLFLPTVEADTSLSLGLRLLFSQEVPFLISHYLGVIALLGLCSWIYHAQVKERVYLVGLLGVSLLLAFGSFTPIYPFLYERISVLRLIRFPEKFFYLTFAFLIFVAVRGLSSLDKAKTSRSPWIISGSILLLWSVVYVFIRWKTPLLVRFLESPGAVNAVVPVTAPTVASIFFNLEKQMVVSLIVTLLFTLERFKLIRAPLFQALLVFTVFLDLSLAHKPLQFLRGKELISEAPKLIERPPSDYSRVFYYPPGNSLHPSFLSVLSRPSFDKATELTFNNLLPNAGVLFGFEYFQDIDALARLSYSEFLSFANPLPRERRNKLLGALNVRYLISFRELQIPGVKLVREFPEHLSWLYEVTNPVPRAYVVSSAIHERGAHSTLTRLTSDKFDPARQVVLDTPVRLLPVTNLKSKVVISRYENNRVLINARLSNSGVLVLADSFYPGWKVYINGAEGKIHRANHFFRAVELPAGNHKVEFSYDPESFKVGLTISLFTAGLLLAISLVGWFRRRAQVANLAADISERPITLLSE